MAITVTIRGDGIKKMDQAAETLSVGKMQAAYRRALNEAGGKTKTKTYQALAKQTNLKVSVTRRALRASHASSGKLEYKLSGEGGNISLKYFHAKESEAGVSADPFGQRMVFAGAFLKGGAWPGGRTSMVAGGHAMYRVGGKRLPIKRAKSGVVIPTEMVKGVTASTFETVGTTNLEEQVMRHIKLVTKGVLS